jgi:hypothetical protein
MKKQMIAAALGTALAIGLSSPTLAQGGNEREIDSGGVHPGQATAPKAQPPGKSDADGKGTTGQGTPGAAPRGKMPSGSQDPNAKNPDGSDKAGNLPSQNR